MFEKTFELVTHLARENKVVQERLFDRLDLLLSKEGAAPQLAEALTEVKLGDYVINCVTNGGGILTVQLLNL